jgi:Bacteriophage lambda head decoration protein D
VPNITITNCDAGSVVVELGGTRDGLLVNTVASQVVFAEGTILAQHDTNGNLYPFDPDAVANDIEIPKFVLTYPVTIGASTNAAVTVLTAGKVNQNRLVIHDATPITNVHLNALRDFSIIPVDVEQLGSIDNPQA